MDVIDIGATDIEEPVSININDTPSVNFGSGIELLMNDKNRPGNENVKLDLGDLNDLESELNDLSEGASKAPAPTSNNNSNSIFLFHRFI